MKFLDLSQEILPTERTLILWHVETENFGFDVTIKDTPFTRRGLLSVTSSVYDPLCFISPYVLTAKLLFQILCRSKIGWDDPMPTDLADQWTMWMEELPLLRKFTIPRCFKPVNFVLDTAELHHFLDACEHGYGAVTYLRLVDKCGDVKG